jgi:hypothetical protein
MDFRLIKDLTVDEFTQLMIKVLKASNYSLEYEKTKIKRESVISEWNSQSIEKRI